MEQDKISIKPLNGSAFEIARLIHGYLTKKGLGHSLISQAFILRNIEAWYGHKISRATLCYNLKNLVATGYIKRVTRHRRNPVTGQFECRVTLFCMTWKLRGLFSRLAAYFRGIGWRNLIEGRKKALAAIRAAAQAAPDDGQRSFAEFKAAMVLRGLWGT